MPFAKLGSLMKSKNGRGPTANIFIRFHFLSLKHRCTSASNDLHDTLHKKIKQMVWPFPNSPSLDV